MFADAAALQANPRANEEQEMGYYLYLREQRRVTTGGYLKLAKLISSRP